MLDNCPNSSEFAGVRESMSVVCQSLSLFQIQLHHRSALVFPHSGHRLSLWMEQEGKQGLRPSPSCQEDQVGWRQTC